ncbi:MAG TPA: RidA family protein [Gemmataceae bacterium]|nr:RidA family protein [Gemmataceae bacterium]
MCCNVTGRAIAFFVVLVGIACVIQVGVSPTPAVSSQDKTEPKKAIGKTPQERAESLGIKFEKLPEPYLNGCVKTGKLLFTSGFGSKMKGRLGKDLTVPQGYDAARSCGVDILRNVWNRHGTLNNLRVVKVLGCVNSTPDFSDQHKVMNGCSDLFHDIFGAKTDGYHARSSLGFVALPTGCAVEIEAIFEIKD